MRSAAIRTLGCRLNQAETAQIAATFSAAGFELKSFNDHCDVYVVHSCTITKNADRKSLQYARSIKKKHPDSVIVLAGCLVEAAVEGDFSDTDIGLCVGQKDKFLIPEILAERQLISSIQFPVSSIQHPSFTTTRALIKVQDGCDFCCSYCIVPTARGNPKSRPFNEIIDEIEKLSLEGYKEIILTGANLGRYSHDDRTLIDLLDSAEKISNIKRIRLSSIELSTIERDAIDFMSSSEKVCNYLHVPLQSGDDDVLNAMGRRYTTSQFRDTIEYAASMMSLPGIGTDVITGFPGETDAQFQNTFDFLESLPVNNFHIFPYSIRKGTKAADMPDQIPDTVKKERCERLIKLGEKKRHDFATQYIDKEVSMLVEKTIDGIAYGWTAEYLEAEVTAQNADKNDIITFRADSISSNGTLKN